MAPERTARDRGPRRDRGRPRASPRAQTVARYAFSNAPPREWPRSRATDRDRARTAARRRHGHPPPRQERRPNGNDCGRAWSWCGPENPTGPQAYHNGKRKMGGLGVTQASQDETVAVLIVILAD